jgi:tRNA(adenine34) deaminase
LAFVVISISCMNINSIVNWEWLSQLDYQTYLLHRQRMQQALKLAQQAGKQGDVPVGAIIIDSQGNSIAQAANRKERNQDPTAHAEILALRTAAKVKQNWYLNDCTLYVTLEPCPMCMGAIIQV